jgi:hypothetical protein
MYVSPTILLFDSHFADTANLETAKEDDFSQNVRMASVLEGTRANFPGSSFLADTLGASEIYLKTTCEKSHGDHLCAIILPR